MAISNRERIGRGFEAMSKGLRPFVAREMEAEHGPEWQDVAADVLKARSRAINWDAHALLRVMWGQWNLVFKKTLGKAERSIVSELQEIRNRWAHEETFSTDDAYRGLDSMERLLKAVSAPEAGEIEEMRHELMRVRFQEQARRRQRGAAVTAIEGQPMSDLKPWREIATPHPDVASGRYQQAEFAADLWKVHRGEGSNEYKDSKEFFRRTFLTDGLTELLVNGLERLAGQGGDPVVQLQTNFGGGKTHSLLALYHLFSGIAQAELAGVDDLMKRAAARPPEKVNRVVIDGQRLSPGQPVERGSVKVHTLWGELAWQLGGKKGYEMVQEADATATSPGEALEALIQKHAPCLILIDEWVAYARQLYNRDDLAGGSFDTHFSFAQALTEAVKGVPNAMLVVSIPSSDIEVGGEGGQKALERLKNVVGRLDSPWRPASAEEGFEIVRRRLFEPLSAKMYAERDTVCRAFREHYGANASEYPSGCKEGAYEERLKAAYPIHPELFDRLYDDWSTLEKFQRTRGVLRLMAAVIHSLWERQDTNLLILPSSVPVDDPPVQAELNRYLEDNWPPVLEVDVDGPHSLPRRLDRDNPNLGRYSACRRAARTVFLGSAPTIRSANRGIDDAKIKLGCVQPGESAATFGDALRRLSSQATYLYNDGRRYWFDVHPSVAQLARDRAGQFSEDQVDEEIQRRVRDDVRHRGDFVKVHAFPESSGDVPEEHEARLVVLDSAAVHARGEDSPAKQAAVSILETRGNSPRVFRNTLVFVACDKARAGDIGQAVREYLAWKSIEDERTELNLDPYQEGLARTSREHADETVRHRIPEAFHWLLVPEQTEPDAPVTWRDIRLQGDDALAVRASRKARNEGLLLTEYSAVNLRLELDRIPLWRGDHIKLKELADYFAQYLYLPRLRSPSLLTDAVAEGVALLTWQADAFGFADAWDEKEQRYRGLRVGVQTRVSLDAGGLVVKPDVAAKHVEDIPGVTPPIVTPPGVTPPGVTPPQPPEEAKLTRFHGSVRLRAMQMGADAGKVAENVVAYLQGLMGAEVDVHLEISARMPDGVPENVVRIVSENCRSLKFEHQEFEEE